MFFFQLLKLELPMILFRRRLISVGLFKSYSGASFACLLTSSRRYVAGVCHVAVCFDVIVPLVFV